MLEIVSDDKTQLRKHKIAYGGCSVKKSFLTKICTFFSYCFITVGGLGFGLISGIVSFANVVEAASGPGIVGITGGVDSRYFVLTSGQALL